MSFIIKTVMWLATAGLLAAGILLNNSGRLSMLLMAGSVVMGLISVGYTFWMDEKESRREYTSEE